MSPEDPDQDPGAQAASESLHTETAREEATFIRGVADEGEPSLAAVLPKPGERIGKDDRFEIVELLGQGGMGMVFRARDRQLDRTIAIKFVLPEQGLSWEQLAEQLRHEAKATARLNHENIVSIFDLDTWKGAPFLVMELLPGESLRALMTRGPIAPVRAADILIDITRGLQHAHQNGVIHRDLKPSNVFILSDGKAKVLDFGLARNDSARTDSLLPQSRSSNDSPLAGTPAYMSPEQWRQEPQDARTDLWALGVMLFELMTSEVPFAASDLTKFLATPLPKFIPPSIRARRAELPQEVDRIIARSVAPYPGDRYSSATEMLAAFTAMRSALMGKRPDAGRRPSTEPQRRVLTMLSCTLSASAGSAESDPEELSEVIRVAHGLALELIEQHEGTIAISVAGQLLACFGYPTAQEDDALRAIRAALQIVKAVHERTTGLEARVGIHTGPAVLQETMAGGQKGVPAIQGDVPGIASWLAGRAEADTVLISGRTEQLVPGVIFSELVSVGAPPGAPNLGVHRVRHEKTVASRFEAAAKLLPLVGRQHEADELAAAWENTRVGRGRFALVGGEPGMGKSRLTHDLQSRVERESGTVLLSQCWPHFRNSAYFPIIAVLQNAMDIRRDDADAEKLRKLEYALTSSGLPIEPHGALLASLLSIPAGTRYPSLGLSPEQQKLKTIESLSELLRGMAERRPVLLVVEDLHWIDHSTLQLLNHLFQRVGASKVMVLVTFRPEFAPPWSEGEQLLSIALDRLVPEAARALVDRAARERPLPNEVIEAIVARADGVPLFLEQLTRMVLESNGRGAVTIPETLHDLLLARLDRLPSAGKEVAQLGAIIGREFTHEVLLHVWPHDKSELPEAIRSLLEAGLVSQTSGELGATYTFRHALIQEAAYQSLLKKARLLSHQRVAQVLIERFPETAELHPELLAHHHAEAGNVAEAVGFFEKAGQRALQRWAQEESINHYQRAVSLLARQPEGAQRNRKEVALLLAMGAPLMAIKGYANPEVEKVYGRARELCKLAGEDTQLFPALLGLWQFYMVSGEIPTSVEMGEQLIGLAQAGGDRAQLLLATRGLGTSLLLSGEMQRSRALTATGLSTYDFEKDKGLGVKFGTDPGVANGLYAAWASWLLGEPDLALSQARHALELAQKLAQPVSIAWALGYNAMIYNYRRDHSEGKKLAEQAVTVASEHRLALWKAWGTIQRGWATAALGDADAGIAEFRLGMAGWMKTGARAGMTYFPVTLAEICLQFGRLDEADTLLREAFEMVKLNGERFYEAELLRLQGDVLCKRGGHNANEAEALLRRGQQIARAQAARSWGLRLATSLFELKASQGIAADAQGELERAYRAFTEGQQSGDLTRARKLLGVS